MSDIDAALDPLDVLLADGHATEVLPLVEHARERALAALAYVDDSNGEMAGILHRLDTLHRGAALAARPDPQRLAQWLFERATDGREPDPPGLDGYSDALGEQGLAAFRVLAEKQWSVVPALGPGEHDAERWGARFRITSVMADLARAEGDVDALVDVLARDLSSAYSFLQIAQALTTAGRADDALAWAERGLRGFPNRTDDRLRDFVAERYQGQGRHGDALALTWAQFEERPSLPTYQLLRTRAERAGAWPAWRERALVLVRERVARAPAPRGRWEQQGGASLLVEIFLAEGDVGAAWAQAQQSGCTDGLWLRLADLREVDHPDDALPIWRRHVDTVLQHASNSAYEQAVPYITRVVRLLGRLDRADEALAYVAEVRTTHKRKRN